VDSRLLRTLRLGFKSLLQHKLRSAYGQKNSAEVQPGRAAGMTTVVCFGYWPHALIWSSASDDDRPFLAGRAGA
jgi:hypothetical protein